MLDIIYGAQYILAMKKGHIVIFLILLVYIATVFAISPITLVMGNNGALTWTVSGISLSAQESFIIQRKTPQTTFVNIQSIPASSNNYSYQWTDPIYKTADVFYIYQIQLIDANGNVIATSNTGNLNTISGVKQTWGSIKAMFR
ncbi:MAG: hypothetical protein ABR980_01210 [Ignavibacteriaceae bacterium]